MKNSPCYNCTEREIGCHSFCDSYIESKKQYERKVDPDLTQYLFDKSARITKEKRRGKKKSGRCQIR